jgi:hypothetical protein
LQSELGPVAVVETVGFRVPTPVFRSCAARGLAVVRPEVSRAPKRDRTGCVIGYDPARVLERASAQVEYPVVAEEIVAIRATAGGSSSASDVETFCRNMRLGRGERPLPGAWQTRVRGHAYNVPRAFLGVGEKRVGRIADAHHYFRDFRSSDCLLESACTHRTAEECRCAPDASKVDFVARIATSEEVRIALLRGGIHPNPGPIIDTIVETLSDLSEHVGTGIAVLFANPLAGALVVIPVAIAVAYSSNIIVNAVWTAILIGVIVRQGPSVRAAVSAVALFYARRVVTGHFQDDLGDLIRVLERSEVVQAWLRSGQCKQPGPPKREVRGTEGIDKTVFKRRDHRPVNVPLLAGASVRDALDGLPPIQPRPHEKPCAGVGGDPPPLQGCAPARLSTPASKSVARTELEPVERRANLARVLGKPFVPAAKPSAPNTDAVEEWVEEFTGPLVHTSIPDDIVEETVVERSRPTIGSFESEEVGWRLLLAWCSWFWQRFLICFAPDILMTRVVRVPRKTVVAARAYVSRVGPNSGPLEAFNAMDIVTKDREATDVEVADSMRVAIARRAHARRSMNTAVFEELKRLAVDHYVSDPRNPPFNRLMVSVFGYYAIPTPRLGNRL